VSQGASDLISLQIDGQWVKAAPEMTILDAASKTSVYIPALCAHPDLPPAPGLTPCDSVFRDCRKIDGSVTGTDEGCQLCLVQFQDGSIHRACDTPVSEGMVISTQSDAVVKQRQGRMASILANHPHECLICPQRDGCDLTTCSMGVPPEKRCCSKFTFCELRRVADYVGISRETLGDTAEIHPIVVDGPLFTTDYSLCIGCTRCVRVCKYVRERSSLAYTLSDGKVVMGWSGATPRESRCNFCGACVEVCPTGALIDKGLRRKPKLLFTKPASPPVKSLPFNADTIEGVPDTAGVLQLFDAQRRTICIKGTPNLREELKQQATSTNQAKFFFYEESGMFTQRESELLQEFSQEHNHLPTLNTGGDLDDLLG